MSNVCQLESNSNFKTRVQKFELGLTSLVSVGMLKRTHSLADALITLMLISLLLVLCCWLVFHAYIYK